MIFITALIVTCLTKPVIYKTGNNVSCRIVDAINENCEKEIMDQLIPALEQIECYMD